MLFVAKGEAIIRVEEGMIGEVSRGWGKLHQFVELSTSLVSKI